MIISPISIYAQEIPNNEKVEKVSEDYYKIHVEVLKEILQENADLKEENKESDLKVERLKSALESERELTDKIIEGRDKLLAEKDKLIEVLRRENTALREKDKLQIEKIDELENKVNIQESEIKVLENELENKDTINLGRNITFGTSGVVAGILLSIILIN